MHRIRRLHGSPAYRNVRDNPGRPALVSPVISISIPKFWLLKQNHRPCDRERPRQRKDSLRLFRLGGRFVPHAQLDKLPHRQAHISRTAHRRLFSISSSKDRSFCAIYSLAAESFPRQRTRESLLFHDAHLIVSSYSQILRFGFRLWQRQSGFEHLRVSRQSRHGYAIAKRRWASNLFISFHLHSKQFFRRPGKAKIYFLYIVTVIGEETVAGFKPEENHRISE